MKMNFLPLDYKTFDFERKNYMKIYGRDEKGKKICVIDSCKNYLWAILKEGLSDKKIKKLIEKIKKIRIKKVGRESKIEAVEILEKNFLEKKVKALKIFVTNYKDLHDVADNLGFEEITKRRGYDLGYITHYIIEKEIRPLRWYEISGEILNNSEKFGGLDSVLDVDFCVDLEHSKEIKEEKYSPMALAFDIETEELKIGKGKILMISLVSENFKKVITWKKINKKIKGVEFVEDEKELLESFVDSVKKLSPDFLVGYYSDGFDFPYLIARAKINKIKLPLGVSFNEPKITRGRLPSVKIEGLVHIDILRFIRITYSQYLKSETLSLDEVSKELLGKGKKKFELDSLRDEKEVSWESFFEYNLQDSILTFELYKKIWPDLYEFSKVTENPLFEASRNGLSKSVESYILHNLKKFNEIPQRKPGDKEIISRREREKYKGAFVFEPIPGFYKDIGMFDFTSYWPSIIVSFNLSLSTFFEKKEKNSLEVDIENKKLYFSKKPGFFPTILNKIINERKKFKEEYKKNPSPIKKARSNAFKLLANASYGYQGFYGARYYCPEASEATTAISRKYIKETIEKINSEGFRTIYSDTDSIAFLLESKTQKEALLLLKKINKNLPGIMELDLEKFYKHGIWVSKKTGEKGAKKKYALLDYNGDIKIRGFAVVRRDWCKLAKELQKKVITSILKEGNYENALNYFKKIVKELEERKVPLEKLIIKTQIKKLLREYKALTPHVVAARKKIENGEEISIGDLIEYYIGEFPGEKLIRDKVRLPEEKGNYDIKYYLTHQLIPAVENIFLIFNLDIKSIVEGNKQGNLNKWF